MKPTVIDTLMSVYDSRMVAFLPATIVSNMLVALVLLRTTRWRQRSATIYILTMAVSDTLSMSYKTWYNLQKYQPSCMVAEAVTVFSSLVSGWMLLCLITEQAIVVVHPIKGKWILNKKTTGVACVAVFSLAVIVTGLRCLSIYANMNNNHVCIGYFSRLPERLIIAIFLSFIPFLWIVVCNMIIIVNVLASRARCVSSSARNTSRHVTLVACLFSLKFLVLTLPLSVFNVVTWYDIKDAYLYVRPTYILLR